MLRWNGRSPMKTRLLSILKQKSRLQEGEHHLLLVWLIFTGVFIFAITVAWHEGVLLLLYTSDKSYISYVISILYFFIAIHCAMRVSYISLQINDSKIVEALVRDRSDLNLRMEGEHVRIDDDTYLPDCIVTSYIHDLLNKNTISSKGEEEEIQESNTELIEVYESRLKGPHEIGWFSADIMIKLGLLGTIVGFIYMLASVSNITDFDVTSMQKILKHMSAGMGTALYTTLAGLTCSMLAAGQYHLLDSNVDKLIHTTKHLAQVYILPKIK